jgi:hypothetical protein
MAITLARLVELVAWAVLWLGPLAYLTLTAVAALRDRPAAPPPPR